MCHFRVEHRGAQKHNEKYCWGVQLQHNDLCSWGGKKKLALDKVWVEVRSRTEARVWVSLSPRSRGVTLLLRNNVFYSPTNGGEGVWQINHWQTLLLLAWFCASPYRNTEQISRFEQDAGCKKASRSCCWQGFLSQIQKNTELFLLSYWCWITSSWDFFSSHFSSRFYIPASQTCWCPPSQLLTEAD